MSSKLASILAPLVDSHCHLNLLDYNNYSLEQVLEDCNKDNIIFLLSVAINLDSYNEILPLSEQYKNIAISAGVHPNEQLKLDNNIIDINSLSDILSKQAANKQVIAIGETGLDYYRLEKKDYSLLKKQKAEQINKFETHIDVAKNLNKPLIIHTREAKQDTIDILKNNNADVVTGVMHCFTEDWAMAKQALDLGFYISISGIVTFKNAVQVQEVANKVPLDRLLVETDCPYLAPMPMRGKPNYPHYVKHTAEYIAKLRNITYEELAIATTKNFVNLFSVSL